ncbi:TPA_asm: P [Plectranthus aromaticus virus 1]|uniref:P n=1 Tax=Plectranthus aromaticus virus 1 TaxID=2793738 RepID=A0A8D9PGT1_9RHAB|nr:P [Plectranthus aromaticus virus 1] [Plectranthus aromaticus virus 1]DAF42298.1 TPA_asm: P [Plectranthus aromaticus virus 1]
MEKKVHPRYSGLPPSAKTSEVMASQYADEVARSGSQEEAEQLTAFMLEWEDHMKREGLTVSNRLIAVLGEITLLCKNSGKEELAGKLANALVDSFSSVIRQHLSITKMMENLETISESLFAGVDELKQVGEGMKKMLPRKKVSIAKKIEGKDITLPPSQESQSKDPGDKTIKQGSQQEEDMDLDPTLSTGDPPTRSGGQSKEDELGSQTMRDARAAYRAHYNTQEFTNMEPTKQAALIEYYANHVLGITPSVMSHGPRIKSMVYDLTDKERVIEVCNKIKAGTLTEGIITESVEEMVDAINTCGEAYGGYKAQEIITDDRSRMIITQSSYAL